MPGIPNNLPQQLTSYIGRSADIEAVANRLEESRLVTISGAGGLGKTRLAIEVASRLCRRFPGGVWFVDLTARPETEPLDQFVVSALGGHMDSKSPKPDLCGYLRDKQALLILDNCEQVIDECAQLVHELLRTCPRLVILTTGRQSFNIDGEVLYRLAPMELPAADERLDVHAAQQCDAVQLFIERAHGRRGDFELTARNAQAIVRLCRSLDGMPLALELAAACVQVLSVEQIVERLDDRFRLLSRGSRTAPARQQSLMALIAWSYDLLSPAEQNLLLCLSVFAGGFGFEACRAIVSSIDEYELIDLFRSLVDKSLLTREERQGKVRYRMLETIRQYALDKQANRPEYEDLRHRHLSYYLQLCETAGSEFSGHAQAEWVSRLRDEYENVREAILWASATPDRVDKALRIVWALRWYWVVYGALADGRELSSRVICAPGAGEHRREQGRAIDSLGMLAWYQGDDTVAQGYLEQGLEIARSAGDSVSIAFALKGLGSVARRQGDYERARILCEEALALDEQSGDAVTIALSLLTLGRVSVQRGAYDEAARLLERSLTFFEELGDTFGTATALYELADLASQQRRYNQATRLALESLESFKELGVKFRMAQCLRLLAEVASSQNKAEQVAALYGAADSLFNDIGSTLPADERLEHERHVALARILIDTASWDAAWNRGAAMSAEDALDYALSLQPDMQEDEDRDAGVEDEEQPVHSRLSRRELEVLQLVGASMSAQQVADHLSISVRTVEAHIRSIYGKLEITGRRALVQYARDNNLV